MALLIRTARIFICIRYLDCTINKDGMLIYILCIRYFDSTINKDGTLIFCPRNFPVARLLKAARVLGT